MKTTTTIICPKPFKELAAGDVFTLCSDRRPLGIVGIPFIRFMPEQPVYSLQPHANSFDAISIDGTRPLFNISPDEVVLHYPHATLSFVEPKVS